MSEAGDLDQLLVVPTPISGWRFFTISNRRLKSIFRGHDESFFDVSDTSWHRAICDPYAKSRSGMFILPPVEDQQASDRHTAPAWDCECGFYAWKSRDLAFTMVKIYADTRNFPQVVAEVELAGHIIVHEQGYRASALRIKNWWPFHDYVLEAWHSAGQPEPTPEHDPRGAFDRFVAWYGATTRSLNRCRHCQLPLCQGHGYGICAWCGQQITETGCWYAPRL